MSKIYIKGGAIIVEGVTTETLVINPAHFDYQKKGSDFYVRDGIENQSYNIGSIGEIEDRDGVLFATEADLLYFLNSSVNRTDVNVQDQTTKPLIVKFNRVTNSTTLASDANQGDTSIVLTSATGIAVGSYIILFNPTTSRFMFATATDISGAPTIVLDTPLDSDFATGTYVDIAITNLKSIGSLASPVVYGLRGVGAPPGVDIKVDVTRILFSATANSTVELDKFINLAKLTNGCVLRKRNSVYDNIVNIKNNQDMYNFIGNNISFLVASNPALGIDGIVGEFKFAGQDNVGVAIRLPIGEDLEILIQDDISTAQSGDEITTFEIIAEGHIVEE